MIIDFHMHIWDPKWLPLPFKRSMARGSAFRRLPFRDPEALLPRVTVSLADPTGEITLAEMDRVGINVAFGSSIDYSIVCGEEAEVPFDKLLEHYAALQRKYPGRLYFFCGVDPRRKGALELFQRSVVEWGLVGLKFYCGAGFYPFDEVCQPFYKKCLELGVPVCFHTSPSPDMGRFYMRFVRPVYLADVQATYPDLVIIYCHTGHTAWWQEAVEVADGCPNSYLELSKWAPEAERDPGAFTRVLARMRDEVGAHRILFGSDFSIGPATSGERCPWDKWLAFFKRLPQTAEEYGCTFTQEEVDLILGGNAQRIMGL